ncbi:hypothetical protein [Endozoicomonas ascidiicola]|uniref:hypothetical protein n=1 Tax=Endozoicomonas ascidiicola TaxID=1698521 RepID=UPI00082E3F8D|nr:hypothetical protein [Endozoicomonas ascidiicola]
MRHKDSKLMNSNTGYKVPPSFTLGNAVSDLVNMTLEQASPASGAIAGLLIAMEYNRPFFIQKLLNLDMATREKVDLLIHSYDGQCPSHWVEAVGFDGKKLMKEVLEIWG